MTLTTVHITRLNQGLLDPAAVVTTVLHEFAESLGAAVDAKDPNTRRHSEEVALAARMLAQEMGMSAFEADIIHVAGHLHDVGKIGTPDDILLKPGPLTRAEWERMRQHAVMGAEIIAPVSCLCECGVFEMILHHHERFDGRGYPDGLKGEAIPLGARVIAVADSLSAMLQNRPYRARLGRDEVREEILRNGGKQFDPEVVEVFSCIEGEIFARLAALRAETLPRTGAAGREGDRTFAA